MHGLHQPARLLPPIDRRLPTSPSAAWALLVPLGLCGLVVLVVLAYKLSGRDPQHLLRDPAAMLGVSPAIGMLSYLGALSIGVAAAVCLFAARHVRQANGMLTFAGVLSATLAADDLLMLHEHVGPRAFGIPEPVFLAAYAMAALSMLWIYRQQLAPRHAPVLWLAFGCLALSAGVDVLSQLLSAEEGQIVIAEDVLKLFGWLIWASFWIRQSSAAMPCSRDTAA